MNVQAMHEMYRRMLVIRYFEETALALQAEGILLGALHPSIGQEAEIVGACAALRIDDYMVGNHRSHGHPIAKGAAVAPLMAELLGKATGVNRGKGGSMHLADFAVGSLGETSIVGSGFPVAVGAALGAWQQGTDRVSLCFFGDGASNEGTFHESLNLASIWRLPVIFLCENNLYGVSTPIRSVMAIEHVADRASAYGMPGEIVDGQDVVAVHDVVAAAVARARRGEGPTLIEAKTYRYLEHAVGVPLDAYRQASEIDAWRARDPIALARKAFVAGGAMTDAQADALDVSARDEVDAARRFAIESPISPLEAAYEHVYATPF